MSDDQLRMELTTVSLELDLLGWPLLLRCAVLRLVLVLTTFCSDP